MIQSGERDHENPIRSYPDGGLCPYVEGCPCDAGFVRQDARSTAGQLGYAYDEAEAAGVRQYMEAVRGRTYFPQGEPQETREKEGLQDMLCARSPKEVVKQWVDAFNAQDVERLACLYDNDAVNHQVANEPVQGLPAIREMFAAEFSAADMVCIVENIFEDGQWAILEWRDPLGLRGCGFFHVVKGKILFQRGYWDKLSFLKQHGSGDES